MGYISDLRRASQVENSQTMLVLRRPLRGNPSSVRLATVGAPLFAAEMASASTKDNDQGDKRQAYAAIGIPEYLIFDPDGGLLSEPIVAWRLQSGAYVPWLAGADGWWHSTVLDVSFQPLGALPVLSVRTHRLHKNQSGPGISVGR